MNKVFAQYTAKVSELRTNMREVLATAKSEPIAVTHHSDTECYLVPANMFEEMVATIESSQRASNDTQPDSFRPNSARMKEIADTCAAALQNATKEQLADFVEY